MSGVECIPGARDCIFRLEEVAERRIVDDQSVLDGTTKMSQVLDVRAKMKHAALAEQACRDQPLRIKGVQQRGGVLG